MEFQPTPDKNNRLHLQANELPKSEEDIRELKNFFGILSLWGDLTTGWILPKAITKGMIITYLVRLGCNIKL